MEWTACHKNIRIFSKGLSSWARYRLTVKTRKAWRRLSCLKTFTQSKNALWKFSPNNFSKVGKEMCCMRLHSFKSSRHISEFRSWSGSFFNYFRSGQDFDSLVLILDEPGLTLYDRMKTYCPAKKMRIKDACMIGIQLIEIIKNFHERDHIVKNITPQTFSFGRN